ncbi:MAG TPA: DinB family protein [Bryobacteraceae bacterium]
MIRLVTALLVLASGAGAQAPEPGQGWLAEFNHAARQLVALAEATPEPKFSWRPGPGVRSVSEVYIHIAQTNYWLLAQAGVKEDVRAAKLPRDAEKSVTAKADVIRSLKSSLDAVRAAYPAADLRKKVQLFGKDTTADAVFLRLLVHNHEHMGQSVAYARMCGVVPPWSRNARR